MIVYRMHREGYRFVAFSTIGIGAFCYMLWLTVRNTSYQWLGYFATALGISLLFLILNFFRNPRRPESQEQTTVIAPCDGKVVALEKVYEPRHFKREMWQISIFMSPLNVHVNRSPIAGEVVRCDYNPGRYYVAWHPKSSEKNEHTFIVVKNPYLQVAFKQIAGKIAKRIKCYVRPGDQINQGQEIGFIKFGSRMDIFVPLECKIAVRLHQRTRGGKTLLAYLPSEDSASQLPFV